MDDGEQSQLDTITDEQKRAYMALSEMPAVMASAVVPWTIMVFTDLYGKSAAAAAERKLRNPAYPHDKWTIFASELDRLAENPKPTVAEKVDELRRASPLADRALKDMVVGYCRLLLLAGSDDDGKALCGQTLRRPTLEAFLGRLLAAVAGDVRRQPELADFSGPPAVVSYKRSRLSELVRRKVGAVLQDVMPYSEMIGVVERVKLQRLADADRKPAPPPEPVAPSPTASAEPAAFGKEKDPVLDSEDAVVVFNPDEGSDSESDSDEGEEGEDDAEDAKNKPITIETGGQHKFVSFDPGDLPIEDAVHLARRRKQPARSGDDEPDEEKEDEQSPKKQEPAGKKPSRNGYKAPAPSIPPPADYVKKQQRQDDEF